MTFLVIYGFACASLGAVLGVVVLSLCRMAAEPMPNSERWGPY